MSDDVLRLTEENRQLKNQLALTKGVSDRILENLVDVEMLKSQLEAMRAARDAACEVAELYVNAQIALHGGDDDNTAYIAKLRAVGAEP